MTDMTERVQETVAEPSDLIQQAKGRAAFLRDRGEVKSPDLLEAIAAKLAEVEAERVRQWNLRRDADGSRDAAFAACDTMKARVTELEALLQAYQDGTVPDLTAVYLAGGKDRNDEVKELLAKLAEMEAERDDALQTVTNNNDWFGLHASVFSWLIMQPDMPALDLLEGGSEEAEENFKRAILALIEVRGHARAEAEVARFRTAAGEARNAALEEAAKVAHKTLQRYAAEKGNTKTADGRTAIFYGRKAKEAIIALVTGETK